jgi:hypothetical protein
MAQHVRMDREWAAQSISFCAPSDELANPQGMPEAHEDQQPITGGVVPFDGQRLVWGGFRVLLAV